MRFLRLVWSFIGHNFGLKVLSVLIAVGMWVVVFGSQTVEIIKEVPFEVVMGDDQILVDSVPDKVTFRLTGPKAFLRTLGSRIEDPIRANIKNFQTGIFTQRIYSDSIKLPLGVKILSINPNVIQLHVEELKHKLVSVKLQTLGDSMNGFRVLRAEILPPQFRIKGPKNRLDLLNSLLTLPIDLSNLKETSIVPLAFDFKSLGVDPDSPLPELNVEVLGRGQAFRVKHVAVQVRTTGKAQADEEEVTVIVRTDLNDPVKVDGDQIKAEVDVRDMPPGDYLKWVRVQLPERVHLIRVIPPLTRVTIK